MSGRGKSKYPKALLARPAAKHFLDYHFFGDGLEEEYPLDEIREINANRNTLRHKPRLSDEVED